MLKLPFLPDLRPALFRLLHYPCGGTRFGAVNTLGMAELQDETI